MMGLALLGFATAVLAGMGMGGGVLLIPGLLVFFQVDQLQAQITSLLTYIPMALVALTVNIKKQTLETRSIKYMLPLGIVGAVCGAAVADMVDKSLLRKIYGGFLIIFALYQLYNLRKTDN